MRRRRRQENKYLKRLSRIYGVRDGHEAVRAFVRPYQHPPESLELLARRFGIARIVEEQLPFDGGIFEVEDGLEIRLNCFNSAARQRFTLAHEVGHLMLPSVLGPYLQDDGLCTDDDELEKACDAIATELLMPVEHVTSFVATLRGPSTQNLSEVAQRFGVSLHTAARRVHDDLELWKLAFGLWEWKGGAQERWYTGKRFWATRQPSFAAFELARESLGPVRTREFHSQGEYPEALSLEVLNIGRDYLLGMVAQ